MLVIFAIKSLNQIIDNGEKPMAPEHRLDSFIGDATAYNTSSNSKEESIGLTGHITKPQGSYLRSPHTH
jgi:hypothetical protein